MAASRALESAQVVAKLVGDRCIGTLPGGTRGQLRRVRDRRPRSGCSAPISASERRVVSEHCEMTPSMHGSVIEQPPSEVGRGCSDGQRDGRPGTQRALNEHRTFVQSRSRPAHSCRSKLTPSPVSCVQFSLVIERVRHTPPTPVVCALSVQRAELPRHTSPTTRVCDVSVQWPSGRPHSRRLGCR